MFYLVWPPPNLLIPRANTSELKDSRKQMRDLTAHKVLRMKLDSTVRAKLPFEATDSQTTGEAEVEVPAEAQG